MTSSAVNTNVYLKQEHAWIMNTNLLAINDSNMNWLFETAQNKKNAGVNENHHNLLISDQICQ